MAPIETRTIHTQTILSCDQNGEGHWRRYLGVPGNSLATTKEKAIADGWHVATIYLYEFGKRTDKTFEKVLCPMHAKERAKCDHSLAHLVWKAQDGEVAICKMDDSHLVNALKFLADGGRTDEDAYRQMYNEKLERRKVSGANLERLAILNSHWAPPPPDRPKTIDFPVDRNGYTMARYDLVKELAPGEHVVVSRKADKGMVLNLDEDTVRALYTVLRNVGGNPDRTPRGLTQDLVDKIYDAVPASERLQPWVAFYGEDTVSGSVHFLDPERVAERRKRLGIEVASRKGPLFGPGAAPADDDVNMAWLD